MTPAFDDVSIDEVRRFWDLRPCNIRHSPAPVGSRRYFDEVEARKYAVEPHIPGFAEFSRWAGRRVLEIGCGLGTDTINFARAGAEVTAVDISPRSLALARRRAEVFELASRVRFVEADAERLAEFLEPQQYDLVYSFGAIHHSPRPDKILEQVRRHFIAPDGVLKVMVYHRWSWKVLGILLREARGAFWRLDREVAKHSEAQTGCPVTFVYSRAAGARLLREAGFSVTDVRVEHIFPYRVDAYVQYRYEKAMPFRILPKRVMRWLECRLGWHLCLTARPV